MAERVTSQGARSLRSIVLAMLLATVGAGCTNGTGIYTSVEDCQARCDRLVDAGCVGAGMCVCTAESVERSNRCADATGCGGELRAFDDCTRGISGCDFAPCEEEATASLRCVSAFCMAHPTDACCTAGPPPPPPPPPAPRVVLPGEEIVIDGVIERGGAQWPAAPFPHETPPGCPLPEFVPAISSPADAVVLEASGALTVDLTFARDDGEMFSADTGIIVLAGDQYPAAIEETRACLAWSSASGMFPGEITGVPIAAGARVIVAMWAGPGDPEDVVWHLTVRTR